MPAATSTPTEDVMSAPRPTRLVEETDMELQVDYIRSGTSLRPTRPRAHEAEKTKTTYIHTYILNITLQLPHCLQWVFCDLPEHMCGMGRIAAREGLIYTRSWKASSLQYLSTETL